MTTLGLSERPQSFAPLVGALSLFALALGLAVGVSFIGAGLFLLGLIASLWLAAPLVPWHRVFLAVLVVVFAVPIRRFEFPGGLPIEVEPYRLLIALVMVLWACSLLVDDKVTLRRSGLEGPIAVISVGVFGSIVANPGGVAGAAPDVVKAGLFFLSFVLVFYLVATTVNTWHEVDAIVKLLTLGGAVIAFFAVIEYRTGWSLFDQFDRLPFVDRIPLPIEDDRGDHPRPYGSAEHPIALGALLIVLFPLAVYLAQKFGRRWWLVSALLVVGAISTLSRTAVVMLTAVVVVFLWMRPRVMRHLLLWLIPLAIVLKLVVPGAVGTIRYQFNPSGGIIANQSTSAGSIQAGNRLTDIRPVFENVARKPILGSGHGVRVRGSTIKTGRVLDNQWLGLLNDTGFVGLAGWLWLVIRFCRRVGRRARGDTTPEGFLRVSLVASVLAFAIGMITFDAFSFIQVSFVFWVLLALGSVVALSGPLSGGPAPRRHVPATPAAAAASE